jgi:predicted acetylornithine/succinylornithine family transaminase
MATTTLQEFDEKYIGNTYHRFPFEVVKAKGPWITDKKGKKYLDLVTGIAVLPLGHSHPDIVKAVSSQAAKYMHLSNYFTDQNQVNLARLLIENTFADKVFYANSGAEATEVAIKLARRWAVKNRGRKAHEIICMENSFHGRTMGALSLTGQPRFHAGITPMMGGVKVVAYNSIAAVKAAINRKTAAVIVEPVQCEGGVIIPQIDYMTQLKNLCKKYDILLIADEIQTGLGRTGRFLACEHSLITPDITLLGKSLGGGLPLSAVLTTDAVAGAFSYGDHGTTMGGNPVSCAAGLACINHILKKKLIREAASLGDAFRNGLFALKKKHPAITGVRNLGLIIAFDFEHTEALAEECLANGLIINKVQQGTIRLLPPFTLSPAELKQALGILDKALKKVTPKDV